MKLRSLIAALAVVTLFFTQAVPLEGALSKPSPLVREVIFIQDAHCDEPTQLAIANLLHEITKREKVDFIAVEGAWTTLVPEVLRFVRDPKTNRDILLHLLKHGELSGAELFAAETHSPSPYPLPQRGGGAGVRGNFEGLEDKSLYWKYFSVLKEILLRRGEADAFAKELRQKLLDRAAKELNPGLRSLLLDEEAMKERNRSPLPYLETLRKLYRREFNSELTDFRNQLEYPNMLRVFALKEDEKKIGDRRQVREFEVWKKGLLKESGSSTIRDSLEGLWDKSNAAGKPFPVPENLEPYIRFHLLEEELRGEKLFAEIAKLTEMLLKKLARTGKEREFLKDWQDSKLLAKLLKVELSYEEWEKLRMRNSEFGFRNKLRIPHSAFRICHLALSFYTGAGLRDQAMMRNLEKLFRTHGAKKAIVIAGGFHAASVKRYLRDHGILCREIIPVRPPSKEEGFSHRAGKITSTQYQDAILNRSVSLPRFATQPNPIIAQSLGELGPEDIRVIYQLASEAIGSGRPELRRELKESVWGRSLGQPRKWEEIEPILSDVFRISPSDIPVNLRQAVTEIWNRPNLDLVSIARAIRALFVNFLESRLKWNDSDWIDEESPDWSAPEARYTTVEVNNLRRLASEVLPAAIQRLSGEATAVSAESLGEASALIRPPAHARERRSGKPGQTATLRERVEDGITTEIKAITMEDLKQWIREKLHHKSFGKNLARIGIVERVSQKTIIRLKYFVEVFPAKGKEKEDLLLHRVLITYRPGATPQHIIDFVMNASELPPYIRNAFREFVVARKLAYAKTPSAGRSLGEEETFLDLPLVDMDLKSVDPVIRKVRDFGPDFKPERLRIFLEILHSEKGRPIAVYRWSRRGPYEREKRLNEFGIFLSDGSFVRAHEIFVTEEKVSWVRIRRRASSERIPQTDLSEKITLQRGDKYETSPGTGLRPGPDFENRLKKKAGEIVETFGKSLGVLQAVPPASSGRRARASELIFLPFYPVQDGKSSPKPQRIISVLSVPELVSVADLLDEGEIPVTFFGELFKFRKQDERELFRRGGVVLEDGRVILMKSDSETASDRIFERLRTLSFDNAIETFRKMHQIAFLPFFRYENENIDSGFLVESYLGPYLLELSGILEGDSRPIGVLEFIGNRPGKKAARFFTLIFFEDGSRLFLRQEMQTRNRTLYWALSSGKLLLPHEMPQMGGGAGKELSVRVAEVIAFAKIWVASAGSLGGRARLRTTKQLVRAYGLHLPSPFVYSLTIRDMILLAKRNLGVEEFFRWISALRAIRTIAETTGYVLMDFNGNLSREKLFLWAKRFRKRKFSSDQIRQKFVELAAFQAEGASLGRSLESNLTLDAEIRKITGHSLSAVREVAEKYGHRIFAAALGKTSPAVAKQLIELVKPSPQEPLIQIPIARRRDLVRGAHSFSKLFAARLDGVRNAWVRARVLRGSA